MVLVFSGAVLTCPCVSCPLCPCVSVDKAVQCADQDRGILKDRMAKEDADISMDTLKETLKHTQEAILGEKGELEMIREQCDTDISTIGKFYFAFRFQDLFYIRCSAIALGTH